MKISKSKVLIDYFNLFFRKITSSEIPDTSKLLSGSNKKNAQIISDSRKKEEKQLTKTHSPKVPTKQETQSVKSIHNFSPFQSLNSSSPSSPIQNYGEPFAHPAPSKNRAIEVDKTHTNLGTFRDLISQGHFYGFFNGDAEMHELNSFAEKYADDAMFRKFMNLLQACIRKSRRDKAKLHWQTQSPMYWNIFRQRC